MKRNPAAKEKIIIAALDLAAQRPWARVSLRDIAGKAEVSLAALHEFFEDKSDILVGFGRLIDRIVLAAIEEEGARNDLSPRDRLFDIMMERYEALNVYRGGVISILESFRCDPKEAVIACPHLGRSMSWMLEAAGIETHGVTGALKVAGLTALYLKGLRVWKGDDSADLAKVMAALDRDMERVEKWAGLFGF